MRSNSALRQSRRSSPSATDQIITEYEVYDKRPRDSTLLLPAIESHERQLGRAPRLVAADVDKVVADDAQSNPTVHSVVAFVPAAIESRASLDLADAPFATGSPFLPVAEPALLLFLLAIGALGGTIRNADALDSFFVGCLFLAGHK